MVAAKAQFRVPDSLENCVEGGGRVAREKPGKTLPHVDETACSLVSKTKSGELLGPHPIRRK